MLMGKLSIKNGTLPITQPFVINLNITGVSELRIVLSQNNGAIGKGIGMTDMIVQRTVE